MTRVVIIDMPSHAERDLVVEQAILGSDIELVHHYFDGGENQLISACRDADVILWRGRRGPSAPGYSGQQLRLDAEV